MAVTAWLLMAHLAGGLPAAGVADPTRLVITDPLPMAALDRERRLRIYLPPGYARSDRRYPVIYLHDGQNLYDDATAYAGEWGLDEALDDHARRTGIELIAVGIDNGGEKRMNELSPWPHPEHGAAEGEAYLSFLVDTVKPWVDAHYRTDPQPSATAIVGSSMGGLMSHYAVHARPDVYGRAGVLSPSYWFAPPVYEWTLTRPLPSAARLYLYMGGAEGPEMVSDTERMAAIVEAAPAAVRRVKIPWAGHNEAAWRAQLPALLGWLYRADGEPATARPAPSAPAGH